MTRLPDIHPAAVLGLALAVCATAVQPAPATAQLSVGLDLYWEFGDGHWRPYEPGVAIDVRYRSGDRYGRRYDDRYHDRYDRRYDDRYPRRSRAAPRVPPGHRPGPGLCRLWYPGRPPGHQPHPVACDRLWGYYGPAYVLVGPRVRAPRRYYHAPRAHRPSVHLRFEYRDDDRPRSPRFRERAGPPGRVGPPGRGRGKGKGRRGRGR